MTPSSPTRKDACPVGRLEGTGRSWGLGWVTHRGPFQAQTFCDSVKFTVNTSSMPVNDEKWVPCQPSGRRAFLLSSITHVVQQHSRLPPAQARRKEDHPLSASVFPRIHPIHLQGREKTGVGGVQERGEGTLSHPAKGDPYFWLTVGSREPTGCFQRPELGTYGYLLLWGEGTPPPRSPRPPQLPGSLHPSPPVLVPPQGSGEG